MRQQRQFAPGHDRACTPVKDLEHDLRAQPAGVVRVVRLGPVADDGRAQSHHFFCDVAVVVQAQHDGHIGSENIPACLQLSALNIVDAIGGAGAVNLQRQRINRAGGLQAEPDFLLKETVGILSDASTRDRPPADDGNHGDVVTRCLDDIEKATNLPYPTEGVKNSPAFNDAKGLIVAQGRGDRVEVVGFLTDVNECNTHIFDDSHCVLGTCLAVVSCSETQVLRVTVSPSA